MVTSGETTGDTLCESNKILISSLKLLFENEVIKSEISLYHSLKEVTKVKKIIQKYEKKLNLSQIRILL
jgi:hypothetical protein